MSTTELAPVTVANGRVTLRRFLREVVTDSGEMDADALLENLESLSAVTQTNIMAAMSMVQHGGMDAKAASGYVNSGVKTQMDLFAQMIDLGIKTGKIRLDDQARDGVVEHVITVDGGHDD